MSERLCGICGRRLEVIKTGISVYDENFHSMQRHSADLLGCEPCGQLYMERSSESHFISQIEAAKNKQPDAWIAHNPDTIIYSADMIEKLTGFFGVDPRSKGESND